MPRLLVTADDFGSGPGRNAGIAEAFCNGIVTGASLLANGAAFADAVRLATGHAIPVGVHLNLSEGQSLSGPIEGLTDAGGLFLGKPGARAAFAGGDFDAGAALRELLAQIDRVRESGLAVTHLDSHQHSVLFPPVIPLLIAAARATGLDTVRLPRPAEPAALDPPGPLGEELALYRRLAPGCAEVLHREGLRTPQGLYGMPLLNRLDETGLLAVLSRLPPGSWELMTHPGHPDPGDRFGGPERAEEVRALTGPAVRATVEHHRLELITFRDLACAS